ncbi:unnamed protein product [Toxocara canis]|uniref:Peptidase M12B domain-containing protein n=1 Tax=Toxocara canis TaxID=6265 RepID=A0A183TZ79_TOXCA|nr:unnamed protein product [Toxocara canis]
MFHGYSYDIYHTTTSVAGVAPVGRMCDEMFACSLVEGLHLGRSFVLAHEMGHNMGMVHDGVQNQCSRSCCLMSAVNGAGKTTWSACSVREFNAFLLQLDESGRGNCLRDVAESISTHDHLKDGRLPGQRFTADQQCSYFWGKDYQVEIPNGKKMDDICRILWCGNSGSTISTAHPALEGSWCGGDKFCIEGQCTEWRNGPKPQPIDGGWSEWSGGDKRCPISQCQITGSIQLKAQMRTCTNPAPNNGGQQCTGSNLRGLICGSVQSSCVGLSRLEFGTRLCTAIKNDPIKPDNQLSGATFLHGIHPCKIWCHMIGTTLIRNKGQFPDGSPCGVGQYCVGGNCMALSCNNEAVVSDPSDCPQTEITTPETWQWSEWLEWSSCSASCGTDGTQKRQRSCSSTVDVGIELDDIKQLIAALNPISPSISPYSVNEKDKRLRIRFKTMDGSKKISKSGEHPKRSKGKKRKHKQNGRSSRKQRNAETLNSIRGICPSWNEWRQWSECSVSCGGGQRSRERECSIADKCEGEGTQIEACNPQECIIETWGDWLPCSVSCGSGFQTRERLCNGVLCEYGLKQARTCNREVSILSLVFHNLVLLDKLFLL